MRFELNSCSTTDLSPGDVHQHGEAGHVIALTAYVCAVSKNHLAALRGPAALSGPAVKQHRKPRIAQQLCRGSSSALCSKLTEWCGSRRHRWA